MSRIVKTSSFSSFVEVLEIDENIYFSRFLFSVAFWLPIVRFLVSDDDPFMC